MLKYLYPFYFQILYSKCTISSEMKQYVGKKNKSEKEEFKTFQSTYFKKQNPTLQTYFIGDHKRKTICKFEVLQRL